MTDQGTSSFWTDGPIKTGNLGFPRIGSHRELKKALEAFWSHKISADELLGTAASLRRAHWELQRSAQIDAIPSGDFSLYDQVLDMAVTLGAIPRRFQVIEDPLIRYFAMARGLQDPKQGIDFAPLEMTKWFDTNYHFIVPELEEETPFALNASKILSEIEEARSLGIETRPVLIGPVTFLILSKCSKESSTSTPLKHLSKVLGLYQELFDRLSARNVKWIQLDEPCLALDLSPNQRKAYEIALPALFSWASRPQILLTTYFGPLHENLDLVLATECDGLHIDLVRGPEQLEPVLKSIRSKTLLSLGVVNGRNIWRDDLDKASEWIEKAAKALGPNRIQIAPSCSLLHLPVDLNLEKTLDPELKIWMAFAAQKLDEIRILAGGSRFSALRDENRAAFSSREASKKTKNPDVRKQVAAITPAMLQHTLPYSKRALHQKTELKLPPFPTTTIGSFPQTQEVRKARANWKSGRTTQDEYEEFLKNEIRLCIEKQEKIGLDVLVHGEFERTDMVEYFGEKLVGFALTSHGWVQSYGSRCVKPPIIYGDVYRKDPMTITWAVYAQSLTQKPVKGMLTGPVTLLQWSFVRDDQPRQDTCTQIALALRGEVGDLENSGITVIQVDEPALREGLPLRRSEHLEYLKWAVEAFRLATCGVGPGTQIHTHMCYSEFGAILDAVAALDSDVLSIETSRSGMELLEDFKKFQYPNEIGPGVYDIHSPRVPAESEMTNLIECATRVVQAQQLWINPDCGLKTRSWPEVEAALSNMVKAAKALREEYRAPQE